jgi:hypothetical protein
MDNKERLQLTDDLISELSEVSPKIKKNSFWVSSLQSHLKSYKTVVSKGDKRESKKKFAYITHAFSGGKSIGQYMMDADDNHGTDMFSKWMDLNS